MKIIIAPAKKMEVDIDNFEPLGMPQFLAQTVQIKECLAQQTAAQLQALWQCNDAIAAQNVQRLATMDLHKNLTPALFAYRGIQYQYMAPDVMEQSQLDYLQTHLRILSGFYGLLRPFDGAVPYRLEMQARLAVGGANNLYDFWGAQLADALAAPGDCVLNLASKEYSKAVQKHLPASTAFITCQFGTVQNGKLREKATACKMARGEMVRWLAEHDVSNPAQVKGFDALGYRFAPEYSTERVYAFVLK